MTFIMLPGLALAILTWSRMEYEEAVGSIFGSTEDGMDAVLKRDLAMEPSALQDANSAFLGLESTAKTASPCAGRSLRQLEGERRQSQERYARSTWQGGST